MPVSGPILSWSQSFALVCCPDTLLFPLNESWVSAEGLCCSGSANWKRTGLLGGGPGCPLSRNGERTAPLSFEDKSCPSPPHCICEAHIPTGRQRGRKKKYSRHGLSNLALLSTTPWQGNCSVSIDDKVIMSAGAKTLLTNKPLASTLTASTADTEISEGVSTSWIMASWPQFPF
ncbi:hypothetical protein B0H66DRAFT_337096 [Apodospora peruviana]|uniref:Uncharacterized protein n=1 Tax=Apodospora peruviana TaxID=516989 RepID=A0AAE0HYK9_9PEZI|nr:hypothetical protein B0H66DRAFT_337096 [Apodospora peruviana]